MKTIEHLGMCISGYAWYKTHTNYYNGAAYWHNNFIRDFFCGLQNASGICLDKKKQEQYKLS